MKKLHIDIETFSPIDLAKCGVYKYAEHALAAILLFAYSIDGGPVIVIDQRRWNPCLWHCLKDTTSKSRQTLPSTLKSAAEKLKRFLKNF